MIFAAKITKGEKVLFVSFGPIILITEATTFPQITIPDIDQILLRTEILRIDISTSPDASDEILLRTGISRLVPMCAKKGCPFPGPPCRPVRRRACWNGCNELRTYLIGLGLGTARILRAQGPVATSCDPPGRVALPRDRPVGRFSNFPLDETACGVVE